MTNEDIERKCHQYAREATPSYTNGDFDRYAIAQACEDGAEWRINSVWHDKNEVIIKPGFILLEFQNKHELCYSIWRVKSADVAATWGKFMGNYKVIRYAYVKDLLPIKEDEK